MRRQASDEELVQSARAGSDMAFALLMQRHRPWVYRLAYAFAREHAQAEDLTQEVFCRLFQRLRAYRSEGRFVPWLKRMAVNVAKNALRAQRRHAAAPGGLPEASDAMACGDPEAVLSSRLLRQEVREALCLLSAEQRRVMLLHYFGGRSIDEIARDLHCPVGTVKSRLHHGRQRIRQALLAAREPADDTRERKRVP